MELYLEVIGATKKINGLEGCDGALATTMCKDYRHLATRGTCLLCSVEDESNYHALVV